MVSSKAGSRSLLDALPISARQTARARWPRHLGMPSVGPRLLMRACERFRSSQEFVMHLIEWLIASPVKVTVGVILLCLFGTIAIWQMPVQLTPEVQIPTLTVETRWPGASPQEVEREIVLEQEEQLQSVEGLRKMTSESMDSVGRITLEFAIGADMSETLMLVNSRLQQVREY